MVIGARALETTSLDLKHRIPALAIFVDPFAYRVAQIARLDVGGPFSSVGEDSTDLPLIDVRQDVSGLRRDDVFLSCWRHHARHAAQDATGGRVIADPAVGLIGHALCQDLLIFRSQRGLLPRSGALGRIELYGLAFVIGVDARPLAFPVGIS